MLDLLPYHARLLLGNIPFTHLFIGWSYIKQNGAAQKLQLYTLLRLTTYSHYSEPRDKVYALQSLSCDQDMETFRVDYKKSARQLFKELAAYYVREEDLSLFYSGRVNKTENFGLPSWVPD
jgi:hypothetical protein